MCFYFQQSVDAQALKSRYKKEVKNEDSFQERDIINGFQHPKVPIVLDKIHTFELFEWGLIPAWAKDRNIQKSTLNAKIETLHEKPSFRYILANRCLVPATGFIEWQWLDAKGKNKQRYLIQPAQSDIFSFAGLYHIWEDKNSGAFVNTFTIITTQANELMSEIHHTKKRMPVILETKDEDDWLAGKPYEKYAFPYQVALQARPY